MICDQCICQCLVAIITCDPSTVFSLTSSLKASRLLPNHLGFFWVSDYLWVVSLRYVDGQSQCLLDVPSHQHLRVFLPLVQCLLWCCYLKYQLGTYYSKLAYKGTRYGISRNSNVKVCICFKTIRLKSGSVNRKLT